MLIKINRVVSESAETLHKRISHIQEFIKLSAFVLNDLKEERRVCKDRAECAELDEHIRNIEEDMKFDTELLHNRLLGKL